LLNTKGVGHKTVPTPFFYSFFYMKRMYLYLSAWFLSLATWTKAIFAVCLAYSLSFFIPIQSFLLGTVLLVFTDTATGIWKAKTRKEPITSAGMRRTIIKIIAYFLAIILSEMVKNIWIKEVDLAYYVSAYIAITELKSNLENLSVITGLDFWAVIKNFVQDKLPKT
jgi:phage-related holin